MPTRKPRRPRFVSWLLTVAVLAVVAAVVASPSAARPAAPGPVGVWPLQPEPEVVATFDPPDVPWGAGHRGVDLLGHAGQAVHAALAGKVSFAGTIAGRGVVVVDHGDTRTTYEPVAWSVPVGQPVTRGQVVGSLQAGPSHCPPQVCLHWGWLRGTVYLDPLDLVGAGPVRLLPLWRDEPVTPVPLPVLTGLRVEPLGRVYADLVTRIAALVGPLSRSPPRPGEP